MGNVAVAEINTLSLYERVQQLQKLQGTTDDWSIKYIIWLLIHLQPKL